jgi:uncharacterized protein involved in exopolysaccharide biosynthesis
MKRPMEEPTEAEEAGGAGFNPEILKSYASFAGRALKARKALMGLVFAVGVVLTYLALTYLPRTYNCTTVLMTVSNEVLDSDRGNPLSGAVGLIMRHENLEALINDTNLKKTYWERRPPVLALKDKLIRALFGEMDDKTKTQVLIGTLEAKLSVEVDDKDDTLSISVNWSDAATTAELAEATKTRFLRMRHNAEISAFQEKMAILDTHASKLREEIDSLAEQMRADLQAKREARAAEFKASGAKLTQGDAKPSQAVMRLLAPKKPITDEQLPELRERLATQKAKLTAAEGERSTRMREEQAKLDELKLRFTPNHPQVITQQERVGMAGQLPSELALLRAEVADMEAQVRQREAMVKAGGTGGSPGSVRVPGAPDAALTEATTLNAPLPVDVLTLLDEKDADPALSAQISGAVVRYGSLRDEVRGAKLALDTAQAAFNHRYQVVIPVEKPGKPTKPKMLVVFGAGLAITLLIMLVLPILLELRRDVLVERWQVDHFQLPVLGELRLPEKGEN